MEYWLFLLFTAIVCVLLGAIGGSAFGSVDLAVIENDLTGINYLTSAEGLPVLIFLLAVLVPIIAVNVRRLHDRDMSGWWFLGVIIASAIPVIAIIASIVYLVLMVMPGTPGPNGFGPDPKGAGDPEVFA